MNSGIRINKEGIWYYHDAEMTRGDIVELFARHLMYDGAGNYWIQLKDECCTVEVEDTPFVIKSVTFIERPQGRIILVSLSDESTEVLDAKSLRISPENVLYVNVKESRFNARFSRAAYYQFAQFIEHDIVNDRYFVSLNGHSYYIRQEDMFRVKRIH